MKRNEEKIEKIGNVTLNLNYYSGVDLYSEGASEDRLLEVVKSKREDEYEKEIEAARSWSLMYHLSHIRENIVTWLPIDGTQSVLEIGSGCGAVTGMLAQLADHVTCIDLSKKRSEINAYRHRERDNIEIIVGNYKDIGEQIEEKYDYVTLIGVLEYADAYIGGENPYDAMLRSAASHLKEGGKLFIAIENQFGLKYFAGCREDHTGRYYDGLEGYVDYEGVRTFSKPRLTKMLTDAGLFGTFYYPYPDYKLPLTIYSDDYLPHKGELTINDRNFDADRMVTFDEGRAFDALIDDGMFPYFANSFAIIAGKGGRIADLDEVPRYVKFANERAAGYRIATTITLDRTGFHHVWKEAVNTKANRHIHDMFENYESLSKIYEGTKLVANRCRFEEGRENAPQIAGVTSKARDRVEMQYLDGVTMEQYLDELDRKKQYGHMGALISEYICLVNTVSGQGEFRVSEDFKRFFGQVELPGSYKASPVSNYDMIFSNIVFDRERREEGAWNVLDYEWTFSFHIPAKLIIYRSLFYYERGRENSGFIQNLAKRGRNIYTEYGISSSEADLFREMEHNFQVAIINGRASLSVMQVIMPTTAIRVDQILKESAYLRNLNMPQIYFSCGDGFKPENIIGILAEVQEDNMVRLEVPISNNMAKLRVDPTEYPCFVHVREIRLQMQKGMDQSIERYMTNGHLISESTFLFDTDDPQLIMDIPRGGKKLIIHYQVRMLPKEFYEDFQKMLSAETARKEKHPSVFKRGLAKLHLLREELPPEGYRYNQKR